MRYTVCVPVRASSSLARDRDNARYRENCEKVRESKNLRGMRDVTKSVQSSPAMPGDRTNNGADARKSRKQADKLSRHMPERAYVLSDTAIKQGDRTVAVRKSTSKLIVRNADGTPNVTETLALVSRWNYHRASIIERKPYGERKEGR